MGGGAIVMWLLLLVPTMTTVSAAQCELAEERSPQDLVSVSFDFWYAVGAQESTAMDNTTTLFDVEQLIYLSIDSESLWCLPVDEPHQETTESTTSTTGLRRRQQRRIQTSVRRLGVVTYTPGRPDQVVVDELCPQALADQTPHCIVVKGEMSIFAVEAEDVPIAVDGLRASIQELMDAGVGQQDEVPGVDHLWYLDRVDAEGVVLLKAISGGGVVGFGLAMKIGVPLLAVLFIIVALLFVPNKGKRTGATARLSEKKDGLVMLPPVTLSTLHGTADHPDSLHQGSYHFTPQGQHYLSTNCSKCLATREDYFYFRDPTATNRSNASSDFWNGEVMSPRLDNMATILEDQPLGGGGGSKQDSSATTPLPITADIKNGIANQHWGIDVHNCGSAMCTRCCTGSGRPQFCKVTSPIAAERDNILVDPNLRTSPVQAEV